MGTEGIIARTVRDVAALLDVVSGHRPGDAYDAPPPQRPFAGEVGAAVKPLRIGVLDHDPAGVAIVDPECATAVRATADVLTDLGHDVADGYPARLRSGVWPVEFLTCVPMLVKREADRLGELIGRPLTEADVEPETWAMIASGTPPTAAEYAAAIDSLRRFAAAVESWWLDDGWDLLLTPTMPAPPPLLGAGDAAYAALTDGGAAMAPMTFTVPYNISGQPAVSLPLVSSAADLPVGVQLVGAWGREDLLLRLASRLEQVKPWASRRPPVAVPAS
jgi:amidase